jgi:hypothetical protein
VREPTAPALPSPHLAAVDTHEIQMMARRDPDWLVYRAFVKI